MGITIYWIEVEAAALARWLTRPDEAAHVLEDAIDVCLEDQPPAPPVLKVTHHDYKARQHLADAFGPEVGDRVQAALQGDRLLVTGGWTSEVRIYTATHLRAIVAAMPDDPQACDHDLRTELARVLEAGHGLLSVWS